MDPKDEKKPDASQAPAQTPPEQKPQDGQQKPPEEKPKAFGLDALTPDDLKKLYEKSPQMFKDAGIVPKEEKPPEQKPKEEVAKPPEQAPSAAPKPKYGDVEINLPSDVKVNREAVDAYLAHAKGIGLSPQQVQAEIDFQTKRAREELAAQKPPEKPKEPTPADLDASNVAALKADPAFGPKFDENMDAARRAAVKFGDKETLGKLATSDPVLVKHFWKLAQADAEDRTKNPPNRSGEEGKTEDETGEDQQTSYLKRRYNHPTSQGMFRPSR